MRWRSIIAVLLMTAVAAGFVGGVQRASLAQDATPPAEASEPAVFRPLAAGTIEVLAPSTANVVLGRVSLAPGASIPFDPNDASAILVYQSTGELTFQVDVPMTVARAGTGTPTPPEAIAADTAFTLRDGDSALFPGSMGGEVRNDGTEEATAWVVDIAHLAEAPSTPTP